jgi:hypothetical protein
LPLATWLVATLASSGIKSEQDEVFVAAWVAMLATTAFVMSMAVNTLVTGLIVFKILKVFLEVKATSVERTLGTTGGTKLRHIIFVIIESGMALLAIQVLRVVIDFLPTSIPNIDDFLVATNQMLNVIISLFISTSLFY